MDVLDYKLAPRTATAGSVLKHAKTVLDMLFSKHSPMIFKIGFTHDPIWRWTNHLYGYAHQRDKWTNMVILHQSFEPFGPAMLEAALIDQYKSRLLV